MNTIRPVFPLSLLLLFAASVAAAPPQVSSLYPAGVQLGASVEVTVAGKLDESTKTWCSRDDVKAELQTEKDKPAKMNVTVPADAIPGVCWFRFYNDEGATSLKPFFISNLPELLEKEPNDSLDTAQPLASSRQLVNGVLEKAGDVDTFAVPLKKGETLVASMEASRTLGSAMDGLLQVVSPRGFVVEQNDDDHENDPQVVVTADADGTWYVRTFAFPATPNSSIRFAGGADFLYRLTLTTGPFVDHTRPMSVARGTSTNVSLFGWNIPGALKALPVNAASPSDSFDIFHPDLATATILRVDPHAVILESEPNDLESPQAIAVPVTVTGCLDQPGDVDVFRFSARKGDKLLLRIESRSLGQPTDPVLRLFDATGKVLKEVETRSATSVDEEIFQPFAADGDYRAEVSDLYGNGGFRFAYRLTVAPQEPDYELSLAADAFLLTPGKPLEVPVTINRKYGFNGEIEIAATGLPEGVSVVPVKSPPKGAEAKTVKLVFQGDAAAPFNGAIHVVGKSLVDNPLERTANATITGLKSMTQDVWLTVAKSVAAPKKPEK